MRTWMDTHLHLMYPERLHYDWALPLPAVNRPFRLEEYQAQAEPLGIRQALHMEVNVHDNEIEDESALVGELAAVPGSMLAGAIASCRPEWPDQGEFVARALDNHLIRGFRRVLHVVPDDVSVPDIFRQRVRALTARGHPFDLCLRSDQLHLGYALAQACPNTQFVLDHCGNPPVASQAMSPWREGITRLASLPNMACKISGLLTNGDASRWPVGDLDSVARDLRPYVEHVIAQFGWERVVWGSDFPVCTLAGDLATWKGATDALLRGCSDAETDALAHGNARRIYRLPP